MRFCIFLLLAGVLDALLTHIGIAGGIIEEGNPMMKFVMEKSWIYFYLIKIFLPMLLMGLYYLRPLTGGIRTLLITASILYFTVLVYHMAWILLFAGA